MQGKAMFVLGAALGYVVGTRTGREGYERLKHQAQDFWRSPKVRRAVHNAEDFARENIPVVGDAVGNAAKKAQGWVDDTVNKHVATDDSTIEPPTAEPSAAPSSTPEPGDSTHDSSSSDRIHTDNV